MPQQLVNFLSSLRWQDWLTIGGFLFGIVTLLAYVEQRRSVKDAAKLAKWAELNLDKSISEKEIEDLLAQKTEMENQITKNIPALARMAVLKEQAELHCRAIAEHYSAWEKLSSELASAAPVPGLEPHIQSAILDRIVPRFLQEQEISRLRTRITVLSVGMAATSAILPFGLGSMLAICLAPALISAAFRLHTLTEEPVAAFESLRPWIHLIYVICSLGLAGFGALLLTVGKTTPPDLYIAWAFCGVGLVLAFAYLLFRTKLDSWLATKFGVDKREA